MKHVTYMLSLLAVMGPLGARGGPAVTKEYMVSLCPDTRTTAEWTSASPLVS